MTANDPDVPPVEAPLARIERALIDEFLRSKGHDPQRIDELPAAMREELLKQASLYASARLSEVDARSHYLHEMHHTPGEPEREK